MTISIDTIKVLMGGITPNRRGLRLRLNRHVWRLLLPLFFCVATFAQNPVSGPFQSGLTANLPASCGISGQQYWATDGGTSGTLWICKVPTWESIAAGSSGSGNVVGPGSSTTGDLPSFSDTTGKVIGDSGIASANVPLLNAANVFTANQAVSKNGAASTPSQLFSGTWFTGGSTTTTKPQVLIEPTGTTSTAWSTNGTGLGVNAASGFTGNLLDLQVNGAHEAYVDSGGIGHFSGGTSIGNSQLGASLIYGNQYQDSTGVKGYWYTATSGINWQNVNRVTTNVNVAIQAIAAQTADLQDWSSSTPTVLAGVTAGGNIYEGLGQKFTVTHGSNATAGFATLSSGSVVVATTALGTIGTSGGGGDSVVLSEQVCSGTCAGVWLVSATASTGFTIGGAATDNSIVYWEIKHVN